MNSRTILKATFFILIIFGMIGCQDKNEGSPEKIQNSEANKIKVFNFGNEQELAAYNKLNLDKNHPNLLNPQISKREYNKVLNSCTNLHQRIGKYLSKNKFDWGVKENSITLVQKIYFNSEGKIENYFFKVLDENVTEGKKEQFANLVLNFAEKNKIQFESNGKFAQCGKTKYLN